MGWIISMKNKKKVKTEDKPFLLQDIYKGALYSLAVDGIILLICASLVLFSLMPTILVPWAIFSLIFIHFITYKFARLVIKDNPSIRYGMLITAVVPLVFLSILLVGYGIISFIALILIR